MSAHNILKQLAEADWNFQDPGDNGALPRDRTCIVNIVSAGSESRTVADPVKEGILLAVNLWVDGGGSVNVDFATAFNAVGDTSFNLASAGDYAIFQSIKFGSSYKWAIIGSNILAAYQSIADTGGFTTATTVETALQEIYQTLESVQGFIALPLNTWRLVASNDVPAIAVVSGNGGTLAVDTSPKLKRVNGATDKALRIEWANSTSIELFTQFAYPPDMDVTATYTVNLRLAKDTNTDNTVTVAVGLFEGIADTNRGGNTAALAAATLATKSVTITPTGGHPNFASVTLIPGTHTTDTIYMYESYILYKKKLLTS